MRIVFFVNIIRQARCIRRIEDFIKNGYDVEVYGFDREGDNRKIPTFEHHIIGNISREVSYFKRLQMMQRSIASVLKTKNKDTMYFIFSLDVALAFMFAGGRKSQYLYEVSDLMELEVNNFILSKVLIGINRYLINKSKMTIMTSEGFADFYFRNKRPDYITIIPNKLNKQVLDLPKPREKKFDSQNITIGFTGAIRSRAVYNFVEAVGSKFPNIRIHLHGIYTDDKIYGKKIQESVSKYSNVTYYGPFKNPYDFPDIYSHIDLVLCLYTAHGNDKILEPNKLYEAIFYEKPIIVSKDTFTGDYVEHANVGYTVNGECIDDICSFLESITECDYLQKVRNCALIPKENSVDNTDDFFNSLHNILN